jgi:hypothetical protein
MTCPGRGLRNLTAARFTALRCPGQRKPHGITGAARRNEGVFADAGPFRRLDAGAPADAILARFPAKTGTLAAGKSFGYLTKNEPAVAHPGAAVGGEAERVSVARS